MVDIRRQKSYNFISKMWQSEDSQRLKKRKHLKVYLKKSLEKPLDAKGYIKQGFSAVRTFLRAKTAKKPYITGFFKMFQNLATGGKIRYVRFVRKVLKAVWGQPHGRSNRHACSASFSEFARKHRHASATQRTPHGVLLLWRRQRVEIIHKAPKLIQ